MMTRYYESTTANPRRASSPVESIESLAAVHSEFHERRLRLFSGREERSVPSKGAAYSPNRDFAVLISFPPPKSAAPPMAA